MKEEIVVFWFRRDLRLDDNVGLFNALNAGKPVLPLFIFDTDILDQLEDPEDRRVNFIHQQVTRIHQELVGIGSSLLAKHGRPLHVFQELFEQYQVSSVFTNHDYEGYSIERDESVKTYLLQQGAGFTSFKDHVIFEKKEVVKDDGLPYTVFTPYSKKWKAQLKETNYRPWVTEIRKEKFYQTKPFIIPSLEEIGFKSSGSVFHPPTIEEEILKKYAKDRDTPSLNGTSRLGVHLRFGTISIRSLVNHSLNLSETFLDELIWREFYQSILANFPQVGKGLAFKPAYDKIQWRNNENEFEAWCNGVTGFPIVDAGMRELNATGFMHNRVRMVVASFLAKHLLIDWRWGESYFASRLMDYEFASNNGGWQWAAGSGCDAAPYFRIFNPYLQAKKFDPEGIYIRKWVPEIDSFDYPSPIVNHEFARKRCLEAYKKALFDQ
jgi:deoxyribodipyrimidine photo-lyase